MAHGNKKYNFEDLKSKGDAIIVKSANIYSTKNHLRIYSKENELEWPATFNVSQSGLKQVKIERVK